MVEGHFRFEIPNLLNYDVSEAQSLSSIARALRGLSDVL